MTHRSETIYGLARDTMTIHSVRFWLAANKMNLWKTNIWKRNRLFGVPKGFCSYKHYSSYSPNVNFLYLLFPRCKLPMLTLKVLERGEGRGGGGGSSLAYFIKSSLMVLTDTKAAYYNDVITHTYEKAAPTPHPQPSTNNQPFRHVSPASSSEHIHATHFHLPYTKYYVQNTSHRSKVPCVPTLFRPHSTD